jgi:hypothetical protein
VSPNDRWRRTLTIDTNGDLLHDEAVYADGSIRMNDDSVGMWNEQSAADLAGKVYLSLCYD